SMAGVFAAVDLNDGSAVGPVSATGHLAEALVFDGVDDRVTVPNHASIDPLNGWTLSAWIKRSAPGVQHGVVEKFDWASGLGGYAMRIGSDNRLRGYVINGVAYNACVGTTSLAAQTWYHVAVTFDPGSDTLRCYVNGVAEAVNAAATLTPIPSRTSLKIGARGNDGGTPFAGSMDEVKIFARSLSPAEVAAEAAR
ncbi:MAG: LamG domain-containing protein, partial [Nitrospiria bacterium]